MKMKIPDIKRPEFFIDFKLKSVHSLYLDRAF